jgi:hypothetical protein
METCCFVLTGGGGGGGGDERNKPASRTWSSTLEHVWSSVRFRDGWIPWGRLGCVGCDGMRSLGVELKIQ